MITFTAGFRRLLAGEGAESRGGLAGIFVLAPDEGQQMAAWASVLDWVKFVETMPDVDLSYKRDELGPAVWVALAGALKLTSERGSCIVEELK